MPPCQTRTTTHAGETSVETKANPITAIEEVMDIPVEISDDHTSLARAFDRLADGLFNTKKSPTLT